MRIVIFGLTVSSSWANGHATPWRGLLRALHEAGHAATFFERDVGYYAAHRDLGEPDFCDLVLYPNWASVVERAHSAVGRADIAIVTSFCPDGLSACDLVLDHPRAVRVFYDLDTPVTLAALEHHGVAVPGVLEAFRCALGYLGTYARDRQPSLERLLLEPARSRPLDRFMVVGSLYPEGVRWPPNVRTHSHLQPREHAAFYSANRLTLSITRQPMREWGYTPSGARRCHDLLTACAEAAC